MAARQKPHDVEGVEPVLPKIADMLVSLLPEHVGFALVIFDMTATGAGPGRVAYIANGNRPQIVTRLREIIKRLEGDA